MGTKRTRALGLAALLLLCTGCGSRADDAVGAAAEEFYSAVSAGDGEAACQLLIPEAVRELEDRAAADCAQAILQEDLPTVTQIASIEVYGRNARVVLDQDTAFLTETRNGWRVIAVASRAPVARTTAV